ncbi:MAG: hypothetical protein ACLUB0_14130 [Blautia hansenii]
MRRYKRKGSTLELDAEPGFIITDCFCVHHKENGVISTFEINIQADPFKYQNDQAVTVSQTSTKMAVRDFETPCIMNSPL